MRDTPGSSSDGLPSGQLRTSTARGSLAPSPLPEAETPRATHILVFQAVMDTGGWFAWPFYEGNSEECERLAANHCGWVASDVPGCISSARAIAVIYTVEEWQRIARPH
jgi:hypothetical protein